MKTKNIQKRLEHLATTALSIAIAASTSALQASDRLEEVIVEAQRKTETVKDTPIAIQAITGDQFQKTASFSLQELARSSPGLKVDSGVQMDIRMRGTGTVNATGVSLRTNLYMDGVLAEQPRAIMDAQYDIQSFEILKGPQGTLYGKSSPTGTINIRTKSPNLSEVDGYVSGSLGNNNLANTQFGISLPIIEDELAIRLAGVYDQNETGQHNVTTGADATNRNTGLRITALWQPNDDLSVRASYNYRESKSNPWYTIVGTQNGRHYDFDDDKVTVNNPDRNTYSDQLAILEVNYVINEHLTLTSVTGYEDQDYTNFQDKDGTASLVGPGYINSTVGGDTQKTYIPLRPQIQQDMRLASEDNDYWDWQIGGYYHRSVTATPVDIVQDAGGGFRTVLRTTYESVAEEFAAYTHQTFKLTDSLNLIAGLRYQSFRTHASQPTTAAAVGEIGGFPVSIPLTPSPIAAEGIPTDAQGLTAHPVTGTLKLQYFFDPDLVGYVTMDRAYRTGAANLNFVGNLPRDFSTVPNESANSIEFGLKGNFLDQRGRFALAIYNQVYKNFQQDIQNVMVYEANPSARTPGRGDTSAIQAATVVAKEAETRGIEAEVNYLINDNWDVGVSLSLNDAKFKDFKDNPCVTGDYMQISASQPYLRCDLSGDRMPQASRWAGILTSNYSQPAFETVDWYFNTLINFQSNQIDRVTRESLGGFATVDLFTGLRAGNENSWDVSLWVKNALNRRVVTSVFNETPNLDPVVAGENFQMVVTNLPRQAGVTARYSF